MDTKNYEEYQKRLLYETFSSRRIRDGKIHRDDHLKKLETLRKNDASINTVLNYHFKDDEITFEMALINVITLLYEEKTVFQEDLLKLIQKRKIKC